MKVVDPLTIDFILDAPVGNFPTGLAAVSVGPPRYTQERGITTQAIGSGPLPVADMVAWMMGVGSPDFRSGHYWLAYRGQSPKVAVKEPETGIRQAVERVHWDLSWRRGSGAGPLRLWPAAKGGGPSTS